MEKNLTTEIILALFSRHIRSQILSLCITHSDSNQSEERVAFFSVHVQMQHHFESHFCTCSQLVLGSALQETVLVCYWCTVVINHRWMIQSVLSNTYLAAILGIECFVRFASESLPPFLIWTQEYCSKILEGLIQVFWGDTMALHNE